MGAGRRPGGRWCSVKLRLLTRLARYLLAIVFLWACAHKILDPQAFAVDIFRYHLMPAGLVNPMAWSLPWIELVLGLALLGAPGWRKPAALLAVLLLTGFTIGMGINIVRGEAVSCGCFESGDGSGVLSAWYLARNTALIILAVLVVRNDQS